MQTAEELKRKLNSTEDMRSVVRTMKAMAAVNIRQYEKAVESLVDYSEVVKMGLSVVLKKKPEIYQTQSTQDERLGGVVFGSDQGMCGQFNENIIEFIEKWSNEESIIKNELKILALGNKAAGLLLDREFKIDEKQSVPASVNGINEATRKVWLKILDWRENEGIDYIYLFYNKPKTRASYDPSRVRLLPTDRQWLDSLLEMEWDSRSLPIFTMEWERLFLNLIHEYLFVNIYRAFAESLNSENAARLSAMQVAEKNIEERIAGLKSQYNRQRQSSITSELLDIISGFEALAEGK